ncbi:MAG: hypothetical protein NZ578_14785 [Candidatus Binatia bacterium]|nr:hypothetical protein [Candidatus Binatia bacterium]
MSTAVPTLSPPAKRDPLVLFLVLSLLLHSVLFLLLPAPERVLPIRAEQFAEVELLPWPPPPPLVAQAPPTAAPLEENPPVEEQKEKLKPEEPLREQIVNPPDQTNEEIPEKTRFLSDRNSAAKEQMVARGVPLPSPVPQEKPQKQEEAQKPPLQTAMKTQPRTPTRLEKPREKPPGEAAQAKSLQPGTPHAEPRTPRLFARPDELLTQGWLSDFGDDQEKQNERQPPQGRDLIALAPPPRESLLSLPGPQGTPDYLPDIRQGNLTFLNTKAHRFAPFVRRVAMRVFQHLIIHQRKYLNINDVVAARDWVTIQAKLDTQGNLRGLVLQTRSGSYSVDESLLKACENGAWDENPPEEAKAEDGYIHFIFRSDIDAQYDHLGLRAIITYLQVGLV